MHLSEQLFYNYNVQVPDTCFRSTTFNVACIALAVPANQEAVLLIVFIVLNTSAC
jgi:hypothetical protein